MFKHHSLSLRLSRTPRAALIAGPSKPSQARFFSFKHASFILHGTVGKTVFQFRNFKTQGGQNISEGPPVQKQPATQQEQKSQSKSEEENNNEDQTFEEWVQSLPFFVHGVWGSLLKPIAFGLLVIGGSIWFANDSEVKHFLRKSKQDLIRKHQLLQNQLVKRWYQFSEANRTVGIVIGINTIVHLAWKLSASVPSLKTIMVENFMHTPAANKVLPLLLSTFSHSGSGHFIFNMVALYTFGLGVHNVFGHEQFIAMYLAGGTGASLTSHLFRLVIRDFAPSLGASGAVLAMAAASTYVNPDMKLAFIFFPFMNFSASSLLPFMVLFDVVGCVGVITRWFRIGFDHAAHLGGAAYGWFYSQQLVEYIKKHRRS